MFFKRIGIAAVIIILLAVTAVIANSRDGVKIKEVRYRCRVESYNPLWHILFFLFSSDNREFLWRGKAASPIAAVFGRLAFSIKSDG